MAPRPQHDHECAQWACPHQATRHSADHSEISANQQSSLLRVVGPGTCAVLVTEQRYHLACLEDFGNAWKDKADMVSHSWFDLVETP